MPEQYWLVHPNGGRQRIDPRQFDLDILAEQARRVGGRLVVEGRGPTAGSEAVEADPDPGRPRFEPPHSALGPLFRSRLARIYLCKHDYRTDMNARPTVGILGGYYRSRSLVRVYIHDRRAGRRPLEELFDTFLHEIAHHIEYSEPESFHARGCGRIPGTMHSRLFWRIMGELKGRWADLQHAEGSTGA